MSSDSLVLHLTEVDFEREVLQSEKLVLVDFWAEWCAPCRAIGVLLEEVAREKSASVKIVKIDVETEQAIAQKFGVYNIPTLIFFKGGKQVDQIIGAVPKRVLVEKIDTNAA